MNQLELASVPGPSILEGGVKLEGPAESPSAPQPVMRKVFIPETRQRLVEVLGDCTSTGRVPTTMDILSLLDAEYPAHGNFVSSHKEMLAAGIHDALDIANWEVCFLTTIGKLGRDGARMLRKYTQDKILIPLDLLEARSKSIEGFDELMHTRDISKWQADVERGYVADIEDFEEVRVKEEVVEMVSSGEGTGIEEIEGWGDEKGSYHTQSEV